MRIRFVKASATWPLRHQVLRPHQSLEDCHWPGDEDPDTFHLQATLGTHATGIVSFLKQKHPTLKGWKQYRLRGMAVHPEFQGQGVGARLLSFAMDHLKAQHADIIWANAREGAVGFYRRHGFQVEGAPFVIEGVGPHSVVWRRV